MTIKLPTESYGLSHLVSNLAMSGKVESVVLCVRHGRPHRIWRQAGGERRPLLSETQDVSQELMRLAHTYPEAYLAWFDERIEPFLSDIRTWPGLIRHRLEILHLSCFQRCDLMVESLGLVDFDSPFLLPGPTDRRYPTWLISPIAGIGLSSAFRAVGLDTGFKEFAGSLFDLGYRGLQRGLCPYSEPGLLQRKVPVETLETVREPLSNASMARLIRRCFGKKWLIFWAAGCGFFRKSWSCIEAGKALVAQDARYADLPLLERLHPKLPPEMPQGASVDVVVATLGRPEHVKNLLEDLAEQTVLPEKVILIEQDPPGSGVNRIPSSFAKPLPFPVENIVVGWVGACRARNLGLERSKSEWVLLLDDDVRLPPGVLAYLLKVAGAYKVSAVNAATYLSNQKPDAGHLLPRVWPSCGGTLLVRKSSLSAAGSFDEDLEGGYGEDYELGIRLRLNGGNILYAPGEPVLHLKAPSGGFRQPVRHPWSGETPEPRPSPVLLYSRAKHTTEIMQKGYRLYHWSKRLASTPVYRWAWEVPTIRRQWQSAVNWAGRLAS